MIFGEDGQEWMQYAHKFATQRGHLGLPYPNHPETGRCRAICQDGGSMDRIQEAIDTCPVNCIHWVDFEELN